MTKKNIIVTEIKELLKDNKPFIKIYISLIVLILFFGIVKLGQVSFFFISIFLNVFIINMIKESIKLLKIKFSTKQKITILCAILFIYLFYSISILTRNFIYYWDFACYYKIQFETMLRFDIGIVSGIRSLIGSTWSGEYGNFLSFIVEAPFALTNKNPDSYVTSCIFVFAPYLVVGFSILLKKINEMFNVKNDDIVFIISLATLVFFPMLYATSIYGQPDIFGLFFIFIIMSITFKYDFKKIELNRLLIIFFSTYFLFISRRWYIYWLISYYLFYGIILIISCVKDKKYRKTKIIYIISYLIPCAIIFLVTLFPLLKNIIINDYSSHYIFYAGGGLISEFRNQIAHLGYITLIIMIIGLFVGLMKKEYREMTLLSIVQIFLIIFLFTRIQEMGVHHSLTLVVPYLLLIIIFIIFLEDNKYKNIVYICMSIFFIINFSLSIIGKQNILTSNVSIKVPYQEDYDEIGEVVDYLEEILSSENTAYMITHTNKYNPDKLRNYNMPDDKISKYLPYGSAVIGTHKFPLELFTSKYIITTTPFEYISVEEKYENVFESLKDTKFEQIKDFDMHNGYHILIYERKEPVDQDEINLYIEALEEESKQFPELYVDILEEYKKSLA